MRFDGRGSYGWMGYRDRVEHCPGGREAGDQGNEPCHPQCIMYKNVKHGWMLENGFSWCREILTMVCRRE